MKKEIEDAVKKYNSDIANLKRENEMVQKRFEETKQAQMSNATQVDQNRKELESTLKQKEEEKKQMASEIDAFREQLAR